MTLTEQYDAAIGTLEGLRDSAEAVLSDLRGGPASNGAAYVEAVLKAANAALASLTQKPEIEARLQSAGL